MTVELAVIVPTRGRPGNIRKVISAWDFTNAWDVADLVLAIDADDPEAHGYHELALEFEHPDTGESLFRVIEYTTWRPMVPKLDATARRLAEEGRYFALGFAGDDHLPQTIGWAERYLEELHRLGTGMVYGDDGYQGRNLSTEWAVTADAVRALGRMVPAPVEHMYCDNSIMETFAAAGALAYLPGVRIEHMHPIARKAPTDAQYQRVNSREQFARDREAYQNWARRDMAGQASKLRALRPDRPLRPNPKRRPTVARSTKPPFPRFFKQVKGLTPVDVEITLADLAIGVPADEAIVEIGTFHGKTALVLAWGARQGNGAKVTAIDPWELEGNVYADEWGDLSGARKWAGYWVNSLGYANHVQLVQAFAHDVAPTWTGPAVGLLFVDGDHTAEGARRDIESWAPHLAPGARIAVDDYVSPDFPGVKEAVDALVAEGFLEPVEVHGDRLAVTALATEGDRQRVTAITSEGVSPSPYPAVSDQVAVPSVTHEVGPAIVTEELTQEKRDELETEWRKVDPEGVAALEASAEALTRNGQVQEGELEGVAAGTEVDALTIPQMKTLAKTRGIVLGIRKDKRAEIVQALRDGR